MTYERTPTDADSGLSVTRRRFLMGAAGVGAALAGGVLAGHWLESGGVPGSRAKGEPGRPLAVAPSDPAPLVLITLYGGNDGLNTVVPYGDPAYAQARPTLGYQASEVLPLADGLGLNPKLTGLHSLWQSGGLAIVRGVGYPEPSLSHFQSMDIWQTADPTGIEAAGWLGRWLDRTPGDPMLAVSVGATLPTALRGEKRSATALRSTSIQLPGGADLEAAFESMQAGGPDRTGLAAAVTGSGSDLLAVRGELDRLTLQPATATATDLASQLGLVAGLIKAGAPTRVYQVSLSSFDTHAAEKANHERLLQELDQSVTTFLAAVGTKGAVVMTYSEFGRRPAENASGGTDHGTAAPLFVAGRGVKGGSFYGEEPSLSSLDANGNLVPNVDFRSVYATILDRVVGMDPVDVLGGRYPLVDFV